MQGGAGAVYSAMVDTGVSAFLREGLSETNQIQAGKCRYIGRHGPLPILPLMKNALAVFGKQFIQDQGIGLMACRPKHHEHNDF